MTDRVSLRLRGRMLERFIGRAIGDGVRMQSVERSGARELIICATEKNARRLLELAEQYGLDMTVTGRSGKPVIKERLMERNTLPLAVVLSFILITSFTSRIWRIEAVSLDGASDEAALLEICRSAQDLGVRPGMLRREVNSEALEMQLHALLPELTHVSVRMEGVYLRVEVAGEEPAPEVYEIGEPRDLVAAQDAIIVYVETLAGKACVKAGDAVRRGQTLITGEERIDTGVTRAIRALGRVVGRVWSSAEHEAPVFETLSVRTGNRRVRLRLCLGTWSWMLADQADFASQQTETELLPVGGLFLPLRMERTILWETADQTVSKDPDALRAETAAMALEKARAGLPKGARETDCWIDYTEDMGILTARATVEAEMDIAAERGQIAD